LTTLVITDAVSVYVELDIVIKNAKKTIFSCTALRRKEVWVLLYALKMLTIMNTFLAIYENKN